MENPWKTLSTKTTYENKWISVSESDVLNPVGNSGIYGVVHFKNRAIAILALDEELNTWLVGQYRYTLNSYEWELPEGGCPEDELPLQTAQRELLEETGIIAASMDLILEMQLSNSVCDEVSFSFVARGLTFTNSSPEETEKLEVKKLPFETVVQMAMNGEIKDALSLATIFKVKLLMEQDKL